MRIEAQLGAFVLAILVPFGNVYGAEAELKGEGISGKVTFTKTAAGVLVSAAVDGLAPGPHGFHIHEKGDCSAGDYSSAGAHFNPTGSKHGDPAHGPRHSGDLGNIIAPAVGTANYVATVPLELEGGENSIVGRSVLVHEKSDDLKTDPSGNSGARIACGVIK